MQSFRNTEKIMPRLVPEDRRVGPRREPISPEVPGQPPPPDFPDRAFRLDFVFPDVL